MLEKGPLADPDPDPDQPHPQHLAQLQHTHEHRRISSIGVLTLNSTS